jgi:hypothetical protein
MSRPDALSRGDHLGAIHILWTRRNHPGYLRATTRALIRANVQRLRALEAA